ncbi:MAG TPA: hypothetical protein VK772_18980 [Puia sp.]|jgi:hypothetical protein|nr:hypothetical protein [Puia sp.]
MTFEIDFLYNGQPYKGLVTTTKSIGDKHYFVKVESENQEFSINIIGKPCGDDDMDWCFRDTESIGTDKNPDKEFLTEIGEAIEKYESINK